MSDHAHDIKKEVKVYLTVFGALLFLTVVTVGVSYLHLSLAAAVALALFVATIKASLVACYFMHLISEKIFIYVVLAMTMTFFIVLMLLPVVSEHDKFVGIKSYPEIEKGAEKKVENHSGGHH